jgi:glycosyltransferase involved in cell wall biosynthesis
MLYIIHAQYKPDTAPANRALSFYRGFSESGVKAHVLYFLPDASHSKVKEVFPNITIEYLWDSHFIEHPLLRYVSYVRYLITFLRRLKKGDIVYIYAKADIMRLLVGRKGVKVFYELTEHPEVHPPYGKASKLKLKDFISHCKRVDGLFVISKGLKDYFVSKGVDAQKISLVNMTVDCNRFDGVQKINEEQTNIVFCGTIKNSIDGVDELIKAFALIAPSYPSVNLRILGRIDAKNKDYQDNVRLVNRLNLNERVTFLGAVPYNDVPQHLVNARVLALDRPNCMQAQYGFPTKLGEYLLSGNPVVVTEVGDIPYYLRDKDNALLAKPGVPESFAEKLSWALDHPNEATEIGKKGKQLALKEFNYLSIVKQTIQLMGL